MGDELRIGFLGAGKMATALAAGWLRAGLIRPENLCAADPAEEACAAFSRATGGRFLASNLDVALACDVAILAVKPQQMADVLGELTEHDWGTRPTLFVSIAAGVTLRQLAGALGDRARIVRVMPNTPCLVGASASAYSANEAASPADLELVGRLMNAVGRAFAVPEKLLDAVTGLSGSGPAFIFVLIEALSDGGVRVGLPRELATQLAAQTVYGSAKLLLETGQHPAALKDMVTSPGGTTIAGLHALERGGLRSALIDAVEAATRRSAELGK